MLKVLPGGRSFKPSEVKYNWVEDLVFFDGPVLSYVRGNSQQDYFYLWVDNDWQFNRWLAIPVTREMIRGYKNREFSLLDIIQQNSKVIFVDIDDAFRVKRAFQLPVRHIPSEIMPKSESFFNPDFCPTGNEVLSDSTCYYLGLDGKWFMEDLAVLQKRYDQIYAFVYTIMNLGKTSVIDNIKRIFADGDWYGGSARVHFFNDLDKAIPSMHEPRIEAINYASPGFIKLELWAPAAGTLGDIAHGSLERIEGVNYWVKDINTFLTEKDLRSTGTVQILSSDAKQELWGMSDNLCNELGLMSFQERLKMLVQDDPIRYAKVLLSFHRRLSDVLPFMERGLLKMKVENQEYQYHKIQ
jgi:hypothetical protein